MVGNTVARVRVNLILLLLMQMVVLISCKVSNVIVAVELLVVLVVIVLLIMLVVDCYIAVIVSNDVARACVLLLQFCSTLHRTNVVVCRTVG